MSGRATARRVVGAHALVLGLSLAISPPRPAFADSAVDVATARAFFVEATRLGKEGRWWEARELYARSLQLKPAPITRYSLGVAQKETGRLADALISFRAFLAEPPEPATAPFVEPARAAIAELEGRVGKVTIVVEPRPIEGLSLIIDGQPAPLVLDTPREIDPGTHDVLARAPGFRATVTRFNVGAGGEATVTIAMARLTKLAGSPSLAGAPVESAPVSGSVPLDPPPAPRSKALPIALLGSGGALLIAGLTVGLVGVKQASQAPTRDGPDASTARGMGIAGDVLAGAGIVTAGAGLVVLLTQGKTSSGAGGAKPTVTLSGLGFSF